MITKVKKNINRADVLDKIHLISFNFRLISRWNGRNSLAKEDLNRIKLMIEKAHQMGKPIRFWATPDTPLAWSLLAKLGVDYINTDNPGDCVRYLSKLE